MNAASKEDRDAWIEAIRMATPTSPQQKRKEKPKEEPKKETSKENGLSPHPVQVERQTTACDAAVAVAAHTDAEEEQREVDEVGRVCACVTSVGVTDCKGIDWKV